ncbi:lysophospholipase, partial [Mesorhizobium sp. M1C.F.Ca.ET.210.01.1.1]
MPRFEGASGQVYYRHWAPLKPTAQIVFLHGYGEHSGLYHRFANSLN